ncbi:ABC transporter substrate-binding protein [Streptomyces sp. NPDC059373]
MRSTLRRVSGRYGVALTTAGVMLAACTAQGSGGDVRRGAAKPTTDAAIPSFTFAISKMPDTLSGFSTYTDSNFISALVTQTLELTGDNAAFSPNLATKAVQTAPTRLVYTLRPDAKFSDGTPLTAQDVAWSITHATDPSQATSANLASVKKAEATGNGQVTVTLKYADPLGRAALAQVQVVQAASAKSHLKDLGTPGALPLGTGPYRYSSQDDQNIVLVPNTHYQGTVPKPRKITFTVVKDNSSAQLAMRSGDVQGKRLTDLKTASQWQSISGTSVYAADDMSSNLVSFDTSKAPFDDIHVRKAVAYAVDRDGVLKAAFGNYATPLKTLVPASELATVVPSEAEAGKFLDSLPTYKLDLKMAKEELVKSKHPQGFSMDLPYNSGSVWAKLLAITLEKNLKEIGIKATPKAVPGNQWAATIFSHKATGIQLLQGFSTTLADPSALLTSFVGKANAIPNSINIANYSSPAVESALKVIDPPTGASSTKDERWKAVRQLMTDTANQVPYLPLFSEQLAFVLADGVAFTQAPKVFDLGDGNWINLLRSTR